MSKIILCGHGTGGKDFLRKTLQNKGFKYGISYTSRPARTTPVQEVEGIDYYFLSREDFENKISEGFWLEYDEFGGNYYGTSKLQFEENDLFIMTRNGLEQLTPEYRARVTIIFIDILEKIRRDRMVERGWNSEKIEARIELDRKEFEGFERPGYDIRITNEDF